MLFMSRTYYLKIYYLVMSGNSCIKLCMSTENKFPSPQNVIYNANLHFCIFITFLPAQTFTNEQQTHRNAIKAEEIHRNPHHLQRETHHVSRLKQELRFRRFTFKPKLVSLCVSTLTVFPHKFEGCKKMAEGWKWKASISDNGTSLLFLSFHRAII